MFPWRCLSCWVDLDVFRLASSSNDLSPGSHFSFPSPNTLTQNCHLWISALPSTAITAITGPIHFLFLRGLGVVFSLFRCVIFLNSFFFCLFQLLLLDIVLFSLMTYLCLQNSRFKLCTLTFLVDIFFFFFGFQNSCDVTNYMFLCASPSFLNCTFESLTFSSASFTFCTSFSHLLANRLHRVSKEQPIHQSSIVVVYPLCVMSVSSFA